MWKEYQLDPLPVPPPAPLDGVGPKSCLISLSFCQTMWKEYQLDPLPVPPPTPLDGIARRPADPRTGLIVSHQGWDMTQAVSGCGGGGLRDRTPRWTTLMWRKTISPGPLP